MKGLSNRNLLLGVVVASAICAICALSLVVGERRQSDDLGRQRAALSALDRKVSEMVATGGERARVSGSLATRLDRIEGRLVRAEKELFDARRRLSAVESRSEPVSGPAVEPASASPELIDRLDALESRLDSFFRALRTATDRGPTPPPLAGPTGG